MSDIKEKFTPETHQTACGEKWLIMDIDLGVSMEMIIKTKEPSCSGDFILWIDGKGHARNRGGHHWESYDLIPITHKPVDLPTDLRDEIKYVAMECGGIWYGYSAMPETGTTLKWRFGNRAWAIMCHNIPKDHAGWENSLHIRTKDGWERAL